MAIEATQQYRGTYHVLGGVISPMDGIGPSDLQIQSLVERVSEEDINEVILALSRRRYHQLLPLSQVGRLRREDYRYCTWCSTERRTAIHR